MTDKGKQYLDLILSEPYIIGHALGFEDLTELNNQWILEFLFAQEDKTLLAHRGSYKTTCLSLAIALMTVYTAPLKNIQFFRKTDGDVKEIINQISKMLKSDLFQMMTQEIYGHELKLMVDSMTEIHTNVNISAKGTSHLIGLGIGTSITGKHADIVITDDIVNIKDRVSKAERERTKTLYQELLNIKNRDGRFINTGTPWHKEDAISMMPNVQKYDCYSTDLMTIEEIDFLKQRMTASLFSANYELKHIADENLMFSNPYLIQNIELIFDGIGHIDASYGGSDGTAFTIAKKVGERIVMYGKRFQGHVDDHINEIIKLHQSLRCGTLYMERNADKGYLAKELLSRGIPVKTYHEKTNKFIKISSYLKGSWLDIDWIELTDDGYMSEILDYTENSEHDDAPDSAASLVRIINQQYRNKPNVSKQLNALKRLGL